MTSRFYDPSERRAQQVQTLFDLIAGRYDLINDLQSFGFHRWWKNRLAAQARRGTVWRALDLCTGTGDMLGRLARDGRQVVGLDFSARMLEKARGRLGPLFPRTALVRADAEAIPFCDGAFDFVSIAYGLRNLSLIERGLREMWRVTRSGGRVAILDFSKPDRPLWRKVYYSYLKCAVPLFGRVFHGDAETYAYIFESLAQYPSAEGLAQILSALPGARVEMRRFLGGIMAIHTADKQAAQVDSLDAGRAQVSASAWGEGGPC